MSDSRGHEALGDAGPVAGQGVGLHVGVLPSDTERLLSGESPVQIDQPLRVKPGAGHVVGGRPAGSGDHGKRRPKPGCGAGAAQVAHATGDMAV